MTTEIAESLPSWKLVWRKGAAPLLSVEELEAIREALTNDDERLLQGATSMPPPLQCVQDWPVEAACLLGYCGAVMHGGFAKSLEGVKNDNAATVAQVEEYFAKKCFDMDQRIGEPAACRWLLNYWDEAPREEARKELLIEVQRSLSMRAEGKTEEANNGTSNPTDAGQDGDCEF